ncbi:patched [Pavlovales sp. CCMP2436]|nr:patched [Pavlovales sp. CCMP2436]
MPHMSLFNLLVAAGAIAFSTSLFLPPTIAFTLVLIVGSIDVLLVGVLILAGLRLNAITFVTLLVSLALAIDYSCHIGHAYEMAEEPTRRLKVQHALGSVGVSILNGGLSTLLGTVFLSVSKSTIFRTFFLMVWSTIVLALLAGMTVLPAILSLMGPLGYAYIYIYI